MIDRPRAARGHPPSRRARASALARAPHSQSTRTPIISKKCHVAAAWSSSSPRARHPRPSSSLDDRTHATAPTRRSSPATIESELISLLPSQARTTTRSSGRDAHEAARIPTSSRREDRACDARRAMRSLSATKERLTRSTRASIFDGFFSSPIRVFYSILFICALEVRAMATSAPFSPRAPTMGDGWMTRATTDARRRTTDSTRTTRA
jgi:hypothetical protein